MATIRCPNCGTVVQGGKGLMLVPVFYDPREPEKNVLFPAALYQLKPR